MSASAITVHNETNIWFSTKLDFFFFSVPRFIYLFIINTSHTLQDNAQYVSDKKTYTTLQIHIEQKNKTKKQK